MMRTYSFHYTDGTVNYRQYATRRAANHAAHMEGDHLIDFKLVKIVLDKGGKLGYNVI